MISPHCPPNLVSVPLAARQPGLSQFEFRLRCSPEEGVGNSCLINNLGGDFMKLNLFPSPQSTSVAAVFVLLLHNRSPPVFPLKWQLSFDWGPFIDNDNKEAES